MAAVAIIAAQANNLENAKEDKQDASRQATVTAAGPTVSEEARNESMGDWDERDVARWLREPLGRPALATSAHAAGLDGPTLLEMTHAAWGELGASSAIDQCKLQAAVKGEQAAIETRNAAVSHKVHAKLTRTRSGHTKNRTLGKWPEVKTFFHFWPFRTWQVGEIGRAHV